MIKLSKYKNKIITISILSSVVVTEIITCTNIYKTLTNISVMNSNIETTAINSSNNKEYSELKQQLQDIISMEFDSISISSIYYIISRCPANMVITSLAVGDEIASSIVVEDIQDDTTIIKEEDLATEESEEDIPPQSEEVVTDAVPETEDELDINTNPPVVITMRGDVPSILSYLDTTILKYNILEYSDNTAFKTVTVQIKR